MDTNRFSFMGVNRSTGGSTSNLSYANAQRKEYPTAASGASAGRVRSVLPARSLFDNLLADRLADSLTR